ncbi:SIR2 family protein [Pedobacter sp.]|uniref:SIR2 family protein n=1 Tax=Pedobacter sp. TaxID=1411316 RepID=UPI003BA8D015
MSEEELRQEIFKRSESNKAKLIELIESGEAILLAGAGVTASMFVTWKGLVEEFQRVATEAQPDFAPFDDTAENYLDFFDRVKAVLIAEIYTNVIMQKFHTDTFEDYHKLLVSMPFRGFVTTNYDTVLENALTHLTRKSQMPVSIDEGINAKVLLSFFKSLNYNKLNARKIFHIHGLNYTPNTILLSQSEYMEKYGYILTPPTPPVLAELANPDLTQDQINKILSQSSLRWTAHRKILWSLLATRRVIFMGFSIEDPYFLQMLNMVKDDLNTYDDEVHMAVFRLAEGGAAKAAKIVKELSQYGIECVFYEDDQSYSGFSKFVSELSGAVSIHPSIPREEHPDAAAAQQEGSENVVDEQQEIPDWMNDQNRVLSKDIRNED